MVALDCKCALSFLMSLKVVEVGEDARGPKIGCSMKLVDQADGTDLDPQVLHLLLRAAGFQTPLLRQL
jgi:hypothetical protein